MTKKAHAMKRGIALLVGCLVGIPAVSQAAPERKSPLADAPAIRKRLELRSTRFELGVGAMQTLNQDFYNAMLVDVKAGFHITDYLAISGSFGFNVTPGWRTSFNSKLNSTLASSCHADNGIGTCDGKNGNPTPENDKTPTQGQASAAQNRIQWVALAQIEFAPITGKFSLFSKIFMNYDFYLIGGAAFVNLMKKGNVEGLSTHEDANGVRPTGISEGRDRHEDRPELRGRHARLCQQLLRPQSRAAGPDVQEQRCRARDYQRQGRGIQ
jgi:hypothetical protein